ncbi:DNA gyrase/topoisomerase IV subunit A [Galactobacter caseinivorans]|uniref:DNA topoisomerase (ATP-hydrolyzing) n=1 Tax=Galactobacter caseinivorans TaxID=2676123 RepID=A0A496PMM3_9MICC|nr:DNA topoisomerase IV subunit A [Galactobacter caseinivorans]RKW71706.1 DNA topoisomerase IV subunit A [Galactobacter caseinivorans]
MARRTQTDPAEDFEENIVEIDVSTEMETSFLEYAYSVIYSRALPDARDGLKPVQRRILYMMRQMGLYPSKGHVKSARVTGEVMGKLHPHGDVAIYDAMVRMAQPFSLRLPLIDGHGNFGSLDDGPAAPRYTEARMAAAAMNLTDDLDENVVDFVPNYDNQLTQPEVLPAAFPNLLVNGTTGIAVGMATNMAPHNLREVVAAARHLLVNPEATLEEIMAFVPGPDLPSGGIIVGMDGIRDAYRTGRGIFRTRAKVTLEQLNARKHALVVTELPYTVGPEKVIEKIKDAADAKKLQGVSDVVDLTDRHHGLRLVIELKNGFNPNAVLQALFKFTPMEDSFGINNVALVDGEPRTLGLVELLRVYVEHRLSVVRRRTAFRLAKKQDRLHLVEGLLIAIVDIDEVIQIIRTSDDTASARSRLQTVFDLSVPQADHILELRLRQLTKFSALELEAERAELLQAIAELEEILGSDPRLRELVSEELQAISEEHGTDRRTVLLEQDKGAPLKGTVMPEAEGKSKKAPLAMEVKDAPCLVVLTATGRLARTPDTTEVLGERRGRHDALLSVVKTTARGHIGIITSAGRMLRTSVVDIPVVPPGSNGIPLGDAVKVGEFVQLARRESVVAVVPLNAVVALGTASGVVKRLSPEYPQTSDEWEAISLKPKDTVVGAAVTTDSDELVFVTRGAQLLHYSASAVRPQGRTAGGMAGVKLAAGDQAIFFGVVSAEDPEAVVVTISDGAEPLPGAEGGSVKVTPLSEYPGKGRATGGVRAHRFLKGEDHLSLAWVGHGPGRASTLGGVARALPTEHGRRDGSGIPLTQSVEVIGPVSATALGTAPDAAGSATAAASGAVARTATTKRAPAGAAGSGSVASAASAELPPVTPVRSRPAPVQDSDPFSDGGAVEVEDGSHTDIQDSLFDD